jgi:hypothetical protein
VSSVTQGIEMIEVDTVLNYTYSAWDLGECTIRHYLIELAKQCWIEEESFGGKRPFGNSGWKSDVYYALADGGFITGVKDGHGNWFDVDYSSADLIISECFKKLQLG